MGRLLGVWLTILVVTVQVALPLRSWANLVSVPGGQTGEEMRFYISNHDQSSSHLVMHPIVGRTNFVFDAKGELEKIPCGAIAFLIRDSDNVTLRNLRLDWERPSMTEARIVGFSDGETTVDIDEERFPVEIRNGRLRMLGPGWSCETRSSRLFNAKSGEMLPGVGDIAFSGAARELSCGCFALKHDYSKDGARIGDVVVLRPKGRPAPMVVISDSRNTVLEDVIIHDAHGMALIVQRSENVVWRGTRSAGEKTAGVFPREGCYASTHADASHFSNVKGQVTVENCWFEGMMDDAINVHSTCLAITNVVSADRVRCRYMHPQAVGFTVFSPGERLRLINGRTLENGPELLVESVDRHDEREVTLKLSEALPSGWGVGDAVENADFQCAVTFRNNVVCNNRARGSLFTTPLPVVVESNLFSHVTGAAILFAGDDYYWYESGACSDVSIRGNVFSNCFTAAGGYSRGIVSFYPVVRDVPAQRQCYHRNVVIEDNAFVGFDAPLLFALSVEGLTWRDNRIRLRNTYQGLEQPPYILRHCRNVIIDGRRMPEDTEMLTAFRSEVPFDGGWSKRSFSFCNKFCKTFILPFDAQGQCVFLDLPAALSKAKVLMNGVCVGGESPVKVPLRVNLTPAVREPCEQNEIAIFTSEDRISGVRLVRTPPVHFGFGDDCLKRKNIKGPLPFVHGTVKNPHVWGGQAVVSTCESKGQEVEYRLFYDGALIDRIKEQGKE